MSFIHKVILTKAIQSVQNKLDANTPGQYQKILQHLQKLQTKLDKIVKDDLTFQQSKQLKKQIQQIYRGNFQKIDYKQFERPYSHINLIDNKIALNTYQYKNEENKLANNTIDQIQYNRNIKYLKAQNIKYNQMKKQFKTRIQKPLQPNMLNKLDHELDKIQKLRYASHIKALEIDYDRYIKQNDNLLETIRKDFKLDQMDLHYINTPEEFWMAFKTDQPFEIITDPPFAGQSERKNGRSNNFVFGNIRYIKQNGNIVPIGFLIQNKETEILIKIFQHMITNTEDYFKRQAAVTDLMNFQNLGVISVIDFDAKAIVQRLLDENKDEFYKVEMDPQYDEGYQVGILVKNVGHKYEEDKPLELKFKGSIFFVKNNDTNCLYAAIISAFIKKQKIVDKKHVFKLDGKSYAIPTKAFDKNNPLQIYLDKPLDKAKERIQNLFYFTQLLISKINKEEEEEEQLEDLEIIKRAEKYLDVKIRITIVNKLNDLYPNSEDELLLALCNDHYNVIIDFKQYINTMNPTYKEFIYCYQHQQLYNRKYQCAGCKTSGEVDAKYYCTFCNSTHVRPDNKIRYECQGCKSILYNTPDIKCLQKHKLKCKKFKECTHCDKIHNSSRKCIAQQEHDNMYFKEGKMKDQQNSFVTWDIESILDNINEDDINFQKYAMKHLPFLVTWIIIIYDKETKTYSQVDHFYDNDLPAKADKGLGNYILSTDDVLIKFIREMESVAKKYKVFDFYAHNAAAYDNQLLLSAIMKVKEQFKFDSVINNNKLLSLKINRLEFKDSFRIIPSPLAKLNKDLALGLEVGKQPQSYTFLTRDIFDQYIQNGGRLQSIAQLINEDILQHKHFDNLSADEFKQYVIDYGHFDFVDQYINYCIQDSFILSKAMQKWSTISLKEQGVNISNYLTAPSMSMNLFTHNCGAKIQIGYQDLKHNKSKCEYRLSQLVQTNTEMINKLLGTNFKQITDVLYNQRFLDTHYNIDITFKADDKNYGLELDGVFYHGLKDLPEKDKYYKRMQERKTQHQKKGQILKDRMDEASFKDIFHVTDIDFIQFEKENNIKIEMPNQYNISNRQILAGGRSECFVHYRKIDKTKERMYGIDFTSLYPSCMVFGNLPLRDLVVGTQSGSSTYTKKIKSNDISKHKFKIDQAYIDQLIKYAKSIPLNASAEEKLQYFLAGADKRKRLIQIKCQMLPPKELMYPVLGSHICNKLLFPLCRTWAEERCLDVNNHKKCVHSIDQRYLSDFWHETDLINALHEGYVFGEIYETHTYQITSFNDKNYKGSDFVNSQMFNKTLNSDQADYADEAVLKQLAHDCNFDYKHVDGIAYIKQKIATEYRPITLNAGVKSFYKLLLNSLYGKTGQNVVRSTTSFDYGEFIFDEYDSSLHKDCKIQLVGANVFKNTYNYEEELQQTQKAQSNASFAGAITAIARTMLYTLIKYINDELKGLVLYSDTDSVYCVLNRMLYPNLSSVTFKNTYSCKCEQKNDPTEFVCAGSKSYAYTDGIKYAQTSKGITIGKTGEVTLEDQSHQLIFDTYKQLVFSKFNIDKKEESITPNNQQLQVKVKQEMNFIKDTNTCCIYTNTIFKSIMMESQKRYIDFERSTANEIRTLPFGYD